MDEEMNVYNKNWKLYFEYTGLGLIVLGLILYNSNKFKIVFGLGLVLFALSFIFNERKSVLPWNVINYGRYKE